MNAMPSFADAPFHAPPDIVLDLPAPPSINRIWRATKSGPGKVYISPEYAKWKRLADQAVMQTAQLRGVKTCHGKFEVQIVLQRSRGDLDNRAKAILDFLQSRCVVVDDKYCERLVMEWGNALQAPLGVRVTVKACG